jgi:ubiquinone/menaquinone biosynthesis C-methylase UbiE
MGEDVRVLAARVGPGGRAVGIDLSATMAATPNEGSGNSNSNVDFVQADVNNLPFEDGCFDAIRADRLLQHTPNAGAALGEIVRVIKPA